MSVNKGAVAVEKATDNIARRKGSGTFFDGSQLTADWPPSEKENSRLGKEGGALKKKFDGALIRSEKSVRGGKTSEAKER